MSMKNPFGKGIDESETLNKFLIVGLGNPGEEYKKTRHNIGFMVIDRISENLNIPFHIKRVDYLLGRGEFEGRSVILLKARTFMNRSGNPVRKVITTERVSIDRIIVIHDDMDMDFTRLKIKKGGGDGGHRGVQDIINSLGTPNFLRLKIGIGRPPDFIDPSIYVLSPFSEEEFEPLKGVILLAVEAVKKMITDGAEMAMNIFNR